MRASAAENDNKREGRTSQRRSEEETNEQLVTRVDSVLTAEVTLRDGVYLWRRRPGEATRRPLAPDVRGGHVTC